jgi:hypothetical protein
MSFYVELFDSVSCSILARAIENETEIDRGWMIPRDYATNRMAAEQVFSSWAKQLVRGLQRAKEAKAQAAAVEGPATGSEGTAK